MLEPSIACTQVADLSVNEMASCGEAGEMTIGSNNF